MQYAVSVTHIDTCLSCYLQDHHNRDGELLIGVGVDGSATYAQVKDELIWEYDRTDFNDDVADAELLDAAIKVEIEEQFSTVPDMQAIFDDSLDCPPSEDHESAEYDDDAEGYEGDEVVDARIAARDAARHDWENAETCYAWFLITYEVA